MTMNSSALAFGDELKHVHPDVWTRTFWDSTQENRLVACRCADCGTFRMPPTAFCWKCRSREIEWVTLPGTGTIYTFTISRHPMTPAARDAIPYVLAVVSLDGAPGTRLISNIVGTAPEDVRIDMKVEVIFDKVSPELTVARFRPAKEGRGHPPAQVHEIRRTTE